VANALYPLWKASLMTELDTHNSLDQPGVDAPHVALVTIGASGYVYSDSHQFFSDVTGVQNTPTILNNAVLISNVFKADGLVFTNVTGTTIGALLMFRQNAGANSTWRLVLYEDTGIVGFPMILNGGNLLVSWSTQGIFAL
jgi:hypothetical protein